MDIKGQILVIILSVIYVILVLFSLYNYNKQAKFIKKTQKYRIRKIAQETDKKLYTEDELLDFGNYLFSDQRLKSLGNKSNKLNNTDLYNWKRKELESIIVNEYKNI